MANRDSNRHKLLSLFTITLCAVLHHMSLSWPLTCGEVCVCFGFIKKEVLGQFDKGHGYAG